MYKMYAAIQNVDLRAPSLEAWSVTLRHCNRHKALFVGLSPSSGNRAAKIDNLVDIIKIVTFNNTGLTTHNYLSEALFWSFEFY